MISNSELETLIATATARGAKIETILDQDALLTEGRSIICLVRVISGAKGIGPCAMGPIAAAERLRAFLAEGV